jgi:hypothetical protein
MAGLLDIFGTGGADTMGLLGMSPTDIARNREDAQAQALYALAGRLFQGGNTGQSIAEGLQRGQQAYKGGMTEATQSQLQNVQLMDMLRKRKQEEQALAEQKRIQTVLGQGVSPEQVTFQGQPSQFPARDDDGNLMPDMAVRPAGFDLARIAPQLIGSAEGRKTLSELIATTKAMGGETTTLGEGAKLVRINPITNQVETVAEGSKKRETVTVGNTVLDKNTMKVLYTAPDADASSIKEFKDFMKLPKNEQAAYIQLQEQKRPVTNINMPSEGERKAGLFQEQMRAASNTIASLGPVDMANKTNQAQFKSAGGMGNIVVNPKIQQYKQAADQWSESYLRVKTGAAATAPEVELNNRTFFPIFGDDADTVKLKERMRKKAEQDLGIMAGRAEVKGSKTEPKPSETPLNFELPTDFSSQLAAEIARRTKAGG